jgi:hypothetical protein
VRNTNTLLGHDGFVGVKTGSDDAAGGCFAFRAVRWIEGKRTTITGVVLGQAGDNRIAAGSRPPTPWSTASPVMGLLHHARVPDGEAVSTQSPHAEYRPVGTRASPGGV